MYFTFYDIYVVLWLCCLVGIIYFVINPTDCFIVGSPTLSKTSNSKLMHTFKAYAYTSYQYDSFIRICVCALSQKFLFIYYCKVFNSRV